MENNESPREAATQRALFTDGADILEESFHYDGYQVVRREFFAHIHEPSITFAGCKLSLNTACLKRLPDAEYVQILVNPEERRLAVRPCGEDEKDSFRWCITGSEKRRPRQITCRIFFAKVTQLMNWNPDYRYKILGKLVRSGSEHLFIFDLTATEVYQRILQDGGKSRIARDPLFPTEWQNQFGLPVEEHRKQLQVNVFDGYTVFSINDKLATAQPENTTGEAMKDDGQPHDKANNTGGPEKGPHSD